MNNLKKKSIMEKKSPAILTNQFLKHQTFQNLILIWIIQLIE